MPTTRRPACYPPPDQGLTPGQRRLLRWLWRLGPLGVVLAAGLVWWLVGFR